MGSEAVNQVGNQEEARQLLAEVKAISLGMRSFEARLRSFEVKANRRETITSDLNLLYQSPNAYRFEMLRSTKLVMNGAKLIYHAGQSTVKVRPGGLLKLLALSMPIGDPQLLSLNGYRLDQITADAILDRISGPDYALSIDGEATVEGERLTLIRAAGPRNTLDPNIASEVVGCDAAGRYRLWMAYARPELGIKDNLMHQIMVSALSTDVSVPHNAFHL